MSRNIVFDNFWFAEHQKQLLTALNSSVGGWIRRGMWIPSYKYPIVKVTPNAVQLQLPDGQRRFIGYATNQYAQGLRRNYKPIWDVLHWWDMSFANRFVPVWNAGFDTYDQQPDATAGMDNWLQDNAPTTNNGTSTELRVGESSAVAARYRTLIKFDFSSITTVPVVTSSIVASLWHHTDDSTNARTFLWYRMIQGWTESGSSWNSNNGVKAWSGMGAVGGYGGLASETTPIASLSFSSAESAGEKQWTNFTTVLLDEMINGVFTNNGFIIKANTESSDSHRFRSSDYATAGNRPKFAFTYKLAAGGFFF